MSEQVNMDTVRCLISSPLPSRPIQSMAPTYLCLDIALWGPLPPFWGIVLACIPEFSLLMQCHRHKHTSRLSLPTRFPSEELQVNDIDRSSWSSKSRPTTWIPFTAMSWRRRRKGRWRSLCVHGERRCWGKARSNRESQETEAPHGWVRC